MQLKTSCFLWAFFPDPSVDVWSAGSFFPRAIRSQRRVQTGVWRQRGARGCCLLTYCRTCCSPLLWLSCVSRCRNPLDFAIVGVQTGAWMLRTITDFPVPFHLQDVIRFSFCAPPCQTSMYEVAYFSLCFLSFFLIWFSRKSALQSFRVSGLPGLAFAIRHCCVPRTQDRHGDTRGPGGHCVIPRLIGKVQHCVIEINKCDVILQNVSNISWLCWMLRMETGSGWIFQSNSVPALITRWRCRWMWTPGSHLSLALMSHAGSTWWATTSAATGSRWERGTAPWRSTTSAPASAR